MCVHLLYKCQCSSLLYPISVRSFHGAGKNVFRGRNEKLAYFTRIFGNFERIH